MKWFSVFVHLYWSRINVQRAVEEVITGNLSPCLAHKATRLERMHIIVKVVDHDVDQLGSKCAAVHGYQKTAIRELECDISEASDIRALKGTRLCCTAHRETPWMVCWQCNQRSCMMSTSSSSNMAFRYGSLPPTPLHVRRETRSALRRRASRLRP